MNFNMNELSEFARAMGKKGGAKNLKKGKKYFREIGKLGLAKRYANKREVVDKLKNDTNISEKIDA